ncbi:hypothetical protein EDB81DRAFT_649654 [Dactylonectria macrodidyma]|uniref:FAD-binding domain-containing protein n=1 Tax=Dactylonectria macrodidyma TaxID=307937 RepID=A0A9P9EXT8_9HYPO|nr:hypothetical protein EDB81DRAFT_649654 [Dactylonectria macrodidyma]
MPLKVAIIGGGIGGLTAAIALRQHPGIQVDVYERASEFQEVGALIGLAPNGLRTLEKLGVQALLEDDVAWRNPSGIPTKLKHWQTGDVLSQNGYSHVPDRRHHFARTHRAVFHKELIKKLPSEILHTSKNATSVQVDTTSATVLFEDETTVKADLVIGADGIRSKVRGSFIPEHKLADWGDAMFRTTFPYSLVEDIEGLDTDSTRWQGPTSWFFASRLGETGYGVTFNLNSGGSDSEQPFQDVIWNIPAEVDDVRDAFKGYHHPVPQIMDRIPAGTLRRYTNAFGPKLDRWTFEDRVALIGDAAHTHGGAFGAGASLAIEDAFTLYLSLRAVFPEALPISDVPLEHLHIALDLYESIRHPHASKVLQTVLDSRQEQLARARSLASQGREESDQQFRARLSGRKSASWLHEHDVEQAFRDAVASKFAREEV